MPDDVVNSSSPSPDSQSTQADNNQQQQAKPEVNAQTGAPAPSQPLPGSMGGNKPPQNQQQQQNAQQKAQEAVRKMKLKVDGRDEELSEDEVVKWAQMGRAAQKRFQEAADLRKQNEQFINMMKTPEGLRKVLANPAIGVDVRKFAEEFLAEQLKMETLSPEQKKIKEMEDRLRQVEEEKKQFEETRRQEEFKKLTDQYTQEYENKIMDAISKGGLPRAPYIVKRMVDYMSSALANGMELEPANVVEMVRQDYISDTSALYGQLDGDTLIKILGDGVANKIRKADLARIKGLQNPPPTQQQESAEEDSTPAPKLPPVQKSISTEGKKYMNIHEWRADMEKKIKR